MQKISLQKRSFFNSIGLDTKNIPSELKVKTTNLTKKIPSEDVVFFKNKNLVTSERKHFRLKNLIGTVSNEYDGKSWIEIFVNNDKSDEMIKQYFKNPNYYFKELRKLDQTSLNHNNEIELYEDNGKFFVKDGTARLALMMTKYLLETSRAQTKEEQSLINKQYIFAANVKSAPKDRDVIYLINMLIEIYGTKLKISKVPGNYECKYVLQYGDRIFEINSKKELENFIIESDIQLDYFEEVVEHIAENEKRILDFFKLERLPNKIKILILSYKPFKEIIISKYGEILNYVRGNSSSETNTIIVLNIEDQIKYTIHKDADIKSLKDTVLHEIVHQCHHVYHNDHRQIIWFSEGLATNLANQNYKISDLNKCDFDKLKNDFSHYKGSYIYAYTIVNYVLNNYSNEEIEKLYKNPNYLREKSSKIFEEAKSWTNNILFN